MMHFPPPRPPNPYVPLYPPRGSRTLLVSVIIVNLLGAIIIVAAMPPASCLSLLIVWTFAIVLFHFQQERKRHRLYVDHYFAWLDRRYGG